MIEERKISSMIFWGPPGCGKTSLARLISKSIDARFVPLSAVTSGVADIKEVVKQAREGKDFFKQDTLLFIDEIHRFNKAQQDALLPHVEDGTLILIGATTENPGFEVNAPLLSRAHVYRLQTLSSAELKQVAERAIAEYPQHSFKKDAIEFIVGNANGDGRSVINAIELAASLHKVITLKVAETALQQKAVYYDKKGDNHFDTISAFIKSMRGNQPDATLHYLARMIKAGEDPVFIARRMVIFASEDITNAQPTALVVATACMQAVHMIGMPEAQIILAQAVTYLATARKSIASYTALQKALADVENMPLAPIPLHLRNPSNKVMKQEGYGKGHERYPWQVERQTGKKIEQEYMPENLVGKKYYEEDWK